MIECTRSPSKQVAERPECASVRPITGPALGSSHRLELFQQVSLNFSFFSNLLPWQEVGANERYSHRVAKLTQVVTIRCIWWSHTYNLSWYDYLQSQPIPTYKFSTMMRKFKNARKSIQTDQEGQTKAFGSRGERTNIIRSSPHVTMPKPTIKVSPNNYVLLLVDTVMLSSGTTCINAKCAQNTAKTREQHSRVSSCAHLT